MSLIKKIIPYFDDIVIEVNTTFIEDIELQLNKCREGYKQIETYDEKDIVEGIIRMHDIIEAKII